MSDTPKNNVDISIEQLRFALDNVPAYVYIKDTNSRYLYANKLTLELFDCDEHSLNGSGDSDFFPPDTVKQLRENDLKVLAGQHSQGEVIVNNPDGSNTYYWEIKTPLSLDNSETNITGILGISTDITERKHLELKLQASASTDFLTGIANRRLFFERLEHAQLKSERTQLYGAIIYIDLDYFKKLNDKLGHSAGDEFLVTSAKRISNQIRNYDTVARLGGDEFIVLLEELSDSSIIAKQKAEQITDKINSAIVQPCQLGNEMYQGAASCGSTLFLGTKFTASEIIEQAYKKMYQIKLGKR